MVYAVDLSLKEHLRGELPTLTLALACSPATFDAHTSLVDNNNEYRRLAFERWECDPYRCLNVSYLSGLTSSIDGQITSLALVCIPGLPGRGI